MVKLKNLVTYWISALSFFPVLHQIGNQCNSPHPLIIFFFFFTLIFTHFLYSMVHSSSALHLVSVRSPPTLPLISLLIIPSTPVYCSWFQYIALQTNHLSLFLFFKYKIKCWKYVMQPLIKCFQCINTLTKEV